MALLTETAAGVYVIAVTPFTDAGGLDLEDVDRMVDFYEGAGATGLTILGQLGEAPKLTAEESRVVARRVIDRLAGRLPVVVGVSAPGLAPMRELADQVMDDGRRRRDGRAALDARRPTIRSTATTPRSARRSARRPSCCRTIR